MTETIYKDTTKLQVSSLLNFARELGYIYQDGRFLFSYLNRSKKDYSNQRCISFNKMVMFHNSEFIRKDYKPNPKRFGGVKQIKYMETIFSRADISHASYAKSVKRVKLQMDKTIGLITQSNKIEFI